jgi:hypothetical protein
MDLNQAGTTNRPGPAGSHADRDGLHYVTAPMAYISPSMERAYSDLVDPSKSTTQVEVHQVRVYDARPVANSLSLEEEGFILQRRQAPTRLPLDPELMDANRSRRFDMPPINQAYWEELLPMLKSLSGGREVIPLAGALTARRSAKARQPGWEAQVGMAHADVTKASADAFLEATIEALGREVAPFSRMAVYQTWQVISPPPHDSTLAFVDSRTVTAADFVFNDCHFGTSNTVWDDFESRIARFSPDHRWYYFSNIEPDEVLVFKGYDTANTNGDNYIHGAIDNPADDVLPRSSVESRYAVLWD